MYDMEDKEVYPVFVAANQDFPSFYKRLELSAGMQKILKIIDI